MIRTIPSRGAAQCLKRYCYLTRHAHSIRISPPLSVYWSTQSYFWCRTMASNSSVSSSKQTNRLIHEQSPYLREHAEDPVDWYPWSQEATDKAKREQKV